MEETERTTFGWLDLLWLLEGLLAERSLEPAERESVERLRNDAFVRAARSVVRRLVRGHSVFGLVSYLTYRARAGVGRAPAIHDSLEPSLE